MLCQSALDEVCAFGAGSSRSVLTDPRLTVSLPLDASSSLTHFRLQVTSEAQSSYLLSTRTGKLYEGLGSTSFWLSRPHVVSNVCCSLFHFITPLKNGEAVLSLWSAQKQPPSWSRPWSDGFGLLLALILPAETLGPQL